jgi:hypothetical protein
MYPPHFLGIYGVSFLKKLKIGVKIRTETRENSSVSDIQIYASRWLGQYIKDNDLSLTPQQKNKLGNSLTKVISKNFGEGQPYNPISIENASLIIENSDQELLDQLAEINWGCKWNDAFKDDPPQNMTSNDWMEHPERQLPRQQMERLHKITLSVYHRIQERFPSETSQESRSKMDEKFNELRKKTD